MIQGQTEGRTSRQPLPMTLWATARAMLIAAIAGPIAGIIALYIGSALIRWTGHWIGGKASARTIRAAMAWSTVPGDMGVVTLDSRACPLWSGNVYDRDAKPSGEAGFVKSAKHT
jgi:Yip1-like protein